MDKSTLISPEDFTSTVTLLRTFFAEHREFLEVHTQNRLSILAACEDPTTVSTFQYSGEVWPLPQTGQMWLEYELLKNTSLPGVFCLSTSYRQEQNPEEGRHDLIFPMFEFECSGDFQDLLKLESDLLTFLGFENKNHVSYENTAFPGSKYMDVVNQFVDVPNHELTSYHEKWMYDKYGDAFFLTHFPFHTSPFWNMKTKKDKWKIGKKDQMIPQEVEGDIAMKCDVIMGGMETIGSAERSSDTDMMREQFHTISDGLYASLLFNKFGKERVEKELDEFLSYDFFPRFGGGIGITRLISAMKTCGVAK